MKIITPKNLSGFMELPPKEQVLFEKIKQKLEETYRLFGFYPIDTPVLERSEILLTCSMTELAARLNIGRASLYRELQKLEERGALVRKGKRILVRDPAVLDAEHRTDVDPTALP